MNDDSTEKRMAGDYEVIQAVHIGDREVVLGENPQDETGMKYMCAFCRQNALFAEYSEVMASDDFPEIVELFGQRIAEQAQKTHIELNKPRIQGIDDRPITAEGCIPISYEDDLHGKIVVIKPEVLRREYRRATRQLKLCMGGFGASPHSRGSACYCVDLYTGKESRYERMDVLGTIQPDTASSGYCIFQRVAFDLKKLAELDPEGTKRFMERNGIRQRDVPKQKQKKKQRLQRER